MEGEIVGVVADTRRVSAAEPPPPQLYSPLLDGSRLTVTGRAVGDGAEPVGNLKQAIRALDPLLPIDRAGGLSDLGDESISSQRLYAVVVSSFTAIALLIPALGMYGLSAYSVSRRSREIAVRLSLGATAGHSRATTLGRATFAGSCRGRARAAHRVDRSEAARRFRLRPHDAGPAGLCRRGRGSQPGRDRRRVPAVAPRLPD
jgi:hypothetical protein